IAPLSGIHGEDREWHAAVREALSDTASHYRPLSAIHFVSPLESGIMRSAGKEPGTTRGATSAREAMRQRAGLAPGAPEREAFSAQPRDAQGRFTSGMSAECR